MSTKDTQSDPVFASSLGELRWILLIWLANFSWVVGYCTFNGYELEGQSVATVVGMPAWVFWGIFVPWIVAAATSSWFALTQIEDQPLGKQQSSESRSETPDG